MNEVTNQRAVEADLEAVGALLQDLDDLHRGALPWLLRRVDGPPLTDFLEAYVSRHYYAMFLAVAPEGALAGVLYMFLRPPARAPICAPTVAEIDALVVNGAFRRQHIGTPSDRPRSIGRAFPVQRRTELGVYEFNELARVFWAAIGVHNVVTSPRLALQRELLRRPVSARLLAALRFAWS